MLSRITFPTLAIRDVRFAHMSRAVLLLGAAFALLSPLDAACGSPENTFGRRTAPMADLPISFIPNRGQWDERVRYAARARHLLVYLQEDEVTLEHRRSESPDVVRSLAIRMTFENSLESVALEGEKRQRGAHSFFVGADPSRWRTGVPGFASVVYRGLYEGVDLRLRESAGLLEYDVLLAEGSDLSSVVIRCDGIDRLELGPEGSLEMHTAFGSITQAPPTTWYELPGGERQLVDCRFRVIDGHRYGFEIPDRVENLPLLIDPVIEWATYLGGSAHDVVSALALAPTGEIVAAGMTSSPDLPIEGSVIQSTHGGSYDWFVAALDSNGETLLWSTYFGGSALDVPFGVAVDDAGRVLVGGLTASSDFPVTIGAVDPTFGGPLEGAVACLDAMGTDLVFSTYLGGSNEDWIGGVVSDGSGEPVVVGYTRSADYPTTPGAYDVNLDGSSDTIVARLNDSGTALVFSTFVGGSTNEGLAYNFGLLPEEHAGLQSIAIEPSGDLLIGGVTNSSDFPSTIGAYDTTYNGSRDGFVCRLSAAGTQILYSTFLGGATELDLVSTVSGDELGHITVGGLTVSPDFPTTPGAYDETHNGNWDAFVARLAPEGNGVDDLLYSTVIGGAGFERMATVLVEASGEVIGSGGTSSATFPTTTGAYDGTSNGLNDAFFFRLTPTGAGGDDLWYSTYIGGQGHDGVLDMVGGDDGSWLLAGRAGLDFPVSEGAYDTSFADPGEFPDEGDGFVLRLDRTKTGVVDHSGFGENTPERLTGVLPNPSNGIISYRIELDEATDVEVSAFDIAGRRVRTLLRRTLPAGVHDLSAGLAAGSEQLPSGVYYLRLDAGGGRWVRQFVLTR